MTTIRRLIALAAVMAPGLLGAQGLGDLSIISGPQYVSWNIGAGDSKKTVSQLSVPFAVVLPFSETFTVDVSTSWADSRVTSKGATSSKISGLTDTQLRANWSLFDNTAIITFGANLATGMYKVPDAQQEAAGQIGSAFLLYPVSSMGSGNAYTGGLALARQIGEWNVGFGASYRYSSPFDAYQVQGKALRFEPGNEGRFRLGVDRAIGDAHVSLGATYSMFSDDKADSTTFATGGRTLGQASIFIPTDNGDWTISGWDLYRQQGEQIGAVAPSENISNVNIGWGFNWGSTYVQPSVEGRYWIRDYEKAGMMGTAGIRLRFDWIGLSVNPALTYSMGKLYTPGTAESIDVNGLRGTLLLRLR